MFKQISLIVLLVIGNIVFAEAVPTAKPWEFGVSAAALFEGANGDNLGNDFPGAGLRVGYNFTQNWSAVGEILYTTPDFGTKNVDVVDYIGSMNYSFSPISSYVPFTSFGLGYRTINDVSGRNDFNLVLGAGLKVPMYNSFQFMIEGKGRWNLEHKEQGLIGTTGVNYFF